eukprot:SM000072S21160  [mRNA]  locus=s72:58403:64831:- [translate_table: standard]
MWEAGRPDVRGRLTGMPATGAAHAAVAAASDVPLIDFGDDDQAAPSAAADPFLGEAVARSAAAWLPQQPEPVATLAAPAWLDGGVPASASLLAVGGSQFQGPPPSSTNPFDPYAQLAQPPVSLNRTSSGSQPPIVSPPRSGQVGLVDSGGGLLPPSFRDYWEPSLPSSRAHSVSSEGGGDHSLPASPLKAAAFNNEDDLDFSFFRQQPPQVESPSLPPGPPRQINQGRRRSTSDEFLPNGARSEAGAAFEAAGQTSPRYGSSPDTTRQGLRQLPRAGYGGAGAGTGSVSSSLPSASGDSPATTEYSGPVRHPVHPARPVPLEIRPHPLEGTLQSEQRVMHIACSKTAVWGATPAGLPVWDLGGAIGKGAQSDGNPPSEDGSAACAFVPVHGPSVTCLAVDTAQQIVWGGDGDGRARAWPLDVSAEPGRNKQEVAVALLVWQAHKSAVTAITVTPYGELWTGSEHGSIRAWPWEFASRALKTAARGDSSAASFLAQAGQDVRGQVALGSNSSGLVHSDVRFLVADRANGRVWSGGFHCIAIWDAQTRDLLRIIGPNAQHEFGGVSPTWTEREPVASSPTEERETPVLDDLSRGYMKVKFSKERKDKGGREGGARKEPWGFWQKSLGAVRRAATGESRAIGEDGGGRLGWGKLGALAAAPDGTVWGGFGRGFLVQWDRHGSRLLEAMPHSAVAIRSLCVVGTRVWVGYKDGKIIVVSCKSAKKLGGWEAHSKSISQLAACGGYIVSLASHGGIRAWLSLSPSPVDMDLRAAMSTRSELYTRFRDLQILCTTWNVGEGRPSMDAFQMWLSCAEVDKASLVVIGLQEIEVGAGSIAVAAAKESVGMGLQEKGSANAAWWLANISATLRKHERLVSRQLAGMLIGVWVKRRLLPSVGQVEVGAVACGFGRALGNKGSVGVRMLIDRRVLCFVNSHLAAHQEAVDKRNQDFRHSYHNLVFGRVLGTVGTAATSVATAAAAGVSSSVKGFRKFARSRAQAVQPVTDGDDSEVDGESALAEIIDDGLPDSNILPDLADADLLLWMGDFNYRIANLTYEDVVGAINDGDLATLQANDQLRLEKAAGRTFLGLHEAAITFPPTYKFDKGSNDPLSYDSSEKRRIPAYCDRVLFRDSAQAPQDTLAAALCHPIHANVLRYDACMGVIDSDHKPVFCLLDVEMAVVDDAAQREQYGNVLRTDPMVVGALQQAELVPSATVSCRRLLLSGGSPSRVMIANTSPSDCAIFEICSDGDPTPTSCQCGNEDHGVLSAAKGPKAGGGLPNWLQVYPASGMLLPKEAAVVQITCCSGQSSDGDSPRGNSWTESQRDKAVVLVVTVRGPFSASSSEHRLCVCHGGSVKRLAGYEQQEDAAELQDQGQPAWEHRKVHLSGDEEGEEQPSKPQPLPQERSPPPLPDLLQWD